MSEGSGGQVDRDASRRAELEAKIRKQVSCEERAFRIVEKLLENTVSPEYLTECGGFITPSHYADIVEERAIVKLCGYPVCGNQLGNVPRQKYHISSKSNRVYDITERKNFCSNQCFKASKYFEKQISTTPVWLRETETPVALKILDPDQNIGSAGFEVVGDTKKSDLNKELKVLKILDRSEVTTTTETTPASSLAGEENLSTGAEEYRTADGPVPESSEPTDTETDLSEDAAKTSSVKSDLPYLKVDSFVASLPEKLEVSPKIKERIDTKPSESLSASGTSSKMDYLMKLLNKRKKLLSSMVDDQPLQSVEERRDVRGTESLSGKFEENLQIKEKVVDVYEDLTLKSESETDFQGYRRNISQPNTDGKSQFKSFTPASMQMEPVIAKKELELWKEFPNLSPQLCLICSRISEWVSLDTLKYIGLIERCHSTDSNHLSEQRLGDNVTETKLVQEVDSTSCVKYQPPAQILQNNTMDYETLQRKSEEYISRVREFYKGPSKPGSKNLDKASGQSQTGGEEESTGEPILPPVDSIAQSRIRRKIVLEKLERSLPEMLVPLGLAIQHISSELRALVSTFSLRSTNITFKPGEWTLVSVFLIKMLSRKILTIQTRFSEGRALHFYHVFLKTLGCSLDDLEKILALILNPKTFG